MKRGVWWAAAAVVLVAWPARDVGFDTFHLPKELWLCGCALVAVLVTRRQPWPVDAVTSLSAAFALVVALSAVFATTPVLAWRQAGLVFAALALFLSSRTLSPDEARDARLALVAAAALVMGLAVLETFGVLFWSSTGRAPGSTLGQRNAVAHLALLVSPVGWWFAGDVTSRGRRVFGYVCAALFPAAMVVTRSRAAWLTLPVVMVAWAVFSSAPWRRRLAPVLLCALALGVTAQLPPTLTWKARQPYRDTLARLVETDAGSGLGRLTQYRATLALVAAHPRLGVGPANWMVEYPTVSPPNDVSFAPEGWFHTGRLLTSDWLALASESGVVALLLAVALASVVARRAWATPDRALVLSLLVAVVGLGSLDSVLQLPPTLAAVAILFGTASQPAPETRRLVAPPMKLLIAAGLSVLTAVAAARMVGLIERTRPRGGYAASEAAVRWNPTDLQSRFELAESYVLESRCDEARPHLEALRRQLPHHRAPVELSASCPTSR